MEAVMSEDSARAAIRGWGNCVRAQSSPVVEDLFASKCEHSLPSLYQPKLLCLDTLRLPNSPLDGLLVARRQYSETQC